MPKYCEDLVNANARTTAFVERTESGKFHRMFMAFGASAKGFAYCHPILGLDGTHLKSKYLGILLIATSVDAMGQLFPVAFGVISVENDDNWLWFLNTIQTAVLLPYASKWLNNNQLVFLSDRQKGLIDEVSTVFPTSRHGYCLRHLEKNFHKKFKNVELKKLLWKAALATEKENYDAALAGMMTINSKTVLWLEKHASSKYWFELHFPGKQYGHLMLNIAEAINAWLLEARELPILSMMEQIRHQLMSLYDQRRNSEISTIGILVKPVA